MYIETDTRKVCRYQKDNYKSEIKRQTIQWPKEKRTNKYQYNLKFTNIQIPV